MPESQTCIFIKKETLTQVFSCEFCDISKTSPVAASARHFYRLPDFYIIIPDVKRVLISSFLAELDSGIFCLRMLTFDL